MSLIKHPTRIVHITLVNTKYKIIRLLSSNILQPYYYTIKSRFVRTSLIIWAIALGKRWVRVVSFFYSACLFSPEKMFIMYRKHLKWFWMGIVAYNWYEYIANKQKLLKFIQLQSMIMTYGYFRYSIWNYSIIQSNLFHNLFANHVVNNIFYFGRISYVVTDLKFQSNLLPKYILYPLCCFLLFELK